MSIKEKGRRTHFTGFVLRSKKRNNTMENYINFILTSEELETIKTAMEMIDSVLKDRVVGLTPQQRKKILKMSDKSQTFVEKTIFYCETKPDLIPNFIDIQAFKTDFEAYSTLHSINRKINSLNAVIDDTAILSGHEAFKTALAIYHSVKNASKHNVPGADAIYNELKKRFRS